MPRGKAEPSPQRTTGSMRYIKLFVMECLDGTIRFDFEPDERGVWYDLLLLGGRMRVKGLLSAGPGQPYPRRWIAGTLNIPEELLDRTLAKCIRPRGKRNNPDDKTPRIEETPDGLHIINWPKYQSEYDRQKPYREAHKEKAKLSNPAYATCQKCGHLVNHCRCDNGPTLTGEEIENYNRVYGRLPPSMTANAAGKRK